METSLGRSVRSSMAGGLPPIPSAREAHVDEDSVAQPDAAQGERHSTPPTALVRNVLVCLLPSQQSALPAAFHGKAKQIVMLPDEDAGDTGHVCATKHSPGLP